MICGVFVNVVECCFYVVLLFSHFIAVILWDAECRQHCQFSGQLGEVFIPPSQQRMTHDSAFVACPSFPLNTAQLCAAAQYPTTPPFQINSPQLAGFFGVCRVHTIPLSAWWINILIVKKRCWLAPLFAVPQPGPSVVPHGQRRCRCCCAVETGSVATSDGCHAHPCDHAAQLWLLDGSSCNAGHKVPPTLTSASFF